MRTLKRVLQGGEEYYLIENHIDVNDFKIDSRANKYCVSDITESVEKGYKLAVITQPDETMYYPYKHLNESLTYTVLPRLIHG